MPAQHRPILATILLLALLATGVAPALAQGGADRTPNDPTGGGGPGGGDSQGSGGATQDATRDPPPAMTMNLPRERVRQVQERLTAAGFDPGPADGIVGPRMHAALRAFQQARGLEPTGEPDDQTLTALGAE